MKFEDAYEEYKIYAQNRHKKQGFYCLLHDFNGKILPYFKDYLIEDLSTKDFISWQNKILEFNYRNSYNKKIYSAFVGFLDYCCMYHGLKENVARTVGNFKNKVELKKDDFYTLEEFNQFIKCVDDEVYKQFFYLLFFTGLRSGEAMALKFSDLEGDYLSITKSLHRRGNREFDTPKNSSSIRKVLIDRKLKDSLLKLKKLYIRKYGVGNYDYFIFGGMKPLSTTTVDRKKKLACEKANIRPITVHQFRHSHATFLLQNGIMINEVSRRLGHSKVSTTLDIYAHTNLEQEKRVLATLSSTRYNFFYCLLQDFKRFITILKHYF